MNLKIFYSKTMKQCSPYFRTTSVKFAHAEATPVDCNTNYNYGFNACFHICSSFDLFSTDNHTNEMKILFNRKSHF